MDGNRRRTARLHMSLSVRVTGHDRRTGKWQELATTEDVSRTGFQMNLRQRVRRGMVLHVSLPLPWKLRQHSHFDPTFQTYAWVARVRPSEQVGMRMVGLEFLGAHPPAGYMDKPWAIYRPPGWGGPERRRSEREARAENLWVVYLSDDQRELSQESGRTENLSRTGLRLCVKAPPADCDLVKLIATDSNFETRALITDRYLGKDGFYRLCGHFIDQEWPTSEAAAEKSEARAAKLERIESNPIAASEPPAVLTVEGALLEISTTLKECPGGSFDESALRRMQRAIATVRRQHGSLLDVSDLLNAIECAANHLYGQKDLGPFGAEKLRMQILGEYLRLTNFLAARGHLAK